LIYLETNVWVYPHHVYFLAREGIAVNTIVGENVCHGQDKHLVVGRTTNPADIILEQDIPALGRS
jgi:hypothetical protein